MIMQPSLPLTAGQPKITLRTRLLLSEVERLIRVYRIIVPCPSRQTLIRLCEEGVFETPADGPSRGGWQVYEDSFWKWAGFDDSGLK